MIKIYDASNSLEANLLKGILEQEGVDAHISGEYLQGGLGELPAMGLISILIEEQDHIRANKIISDWEQGKYSLDDKGNLPA